MSNIVMERQDELKEEMSFFDDWDDKYDYVISLGKQLPVFPEDKKNVENLVKGCQSQVWFDYSMDSGKLHFIATSDALVVSGLIGMLLRVYNDASPQEILGSNIDFLAEIGFSNNLSATRANGLRAMVEFIYKAAKEHN